MLLFIPGIGFCVSVGVLLSPFAAFLDRLFASAVVILTAALVSALSIGLIPSIGAATILLSKFWSIMALLCSLSIAASFAIGMQAVFAVPISREIFGCGRV